MKLSPDQMSLAELRKLKVGDRLILNWQKAPNAIERITGVVSRITNDAFYVKYFRENDPNWETAFFWNERDLDGTTARFFKDPSEYLWSFTRA